MMHIPTNLQTFLQKYTIFFVLGGALLVRLLHISFPFGDYDEGVYIATIQSMIHGHPLYTQTYGSQFPLLFLIASFLFTLFHSIVVLRLISIVASLVTIFVLYKIIARFIDWRIGIIAGCYLAMNSIFLLVSRTFQLDMLWLCFTTCTFYFLLEFLQNKKRIALVLSACCFSLSILTKANILFLFVLLTAIIFLIPFYKKQIVTYIGTYIGIVLAIFFIIMPVTQLKALFLQSVVIRTHFVHQISLLANKDTLLTLFKHEWPIFIVDVIAVLLWIKEKVQKKQFVDTQFFILSLVWLLVTGIVFVIYNPLLQHHLIYIMPPALCVGAYAGKYMLDNYQKFFVVCLLGACITLYSAHAIISDKAILFPQTTPFTDAQVSIAHYIATHTSPHAYIVTDDPILLYFAHRDTTPQLVDTSFVRITSGQLPDTVLLQETKTYHVAMVVAVTGRLDLETSYMQYVQRNFEKTTIAGYNVYIHP